MMFVDNIVDNKLVEAWAAKERALLAIEPAFLRAPDIVIVAANRQVAEPYLFEFDQILSSTLAKI